MKTTIFKLSAFILLFALMGAGCEKEKNDYDPNSIVGKWKLIKVGSCVGKDNFISEITSDSIIKTYNNLCTYHFHFWWYGNVLRELYAV